MTFGHIRCYNFKKACNVDLAEEIGCADPEFCTEICQNPRGCTNIAYPVLVNAILPTGQCVLILAVTNVTQNFISYSSV